jgi:PAS domain S-box-containing protein
VIASVGRQSRGEDILLMTSIVVPLLLIVVAIQGGIVAALLFRRRALRQSEAFFRQLADDAPIIMWTTRPDTTLDYLNKFSVEFTGMPLRELLDEGWLNAVHPDDLGRIQSVYVPAVEAHRSFLMEYRLRRADGIYRWVLDSGIPKYEADGSYTGYVGCSFDITERKDAEEALRDSHREVRHLAGRLIEAQDLERARIARDLHDDVSQQLAGVSMAFSGLKQRLCEYDVSEDVRQELVALQQQTLALARNVRHLSHDLHPTVLEHLGLVKGLVAYCAELQRAHGVAVTCTAEGDFAPLSAEVALCVYRIGQEALRNVIAHADATRADVTLVHADDQAEITVTDDGRGFDATTRLETAKGLGLVSISERARIVGGTVRVVSAVNQGTRVQARIPVKARVNVSVGPVMAGLLA